MQKKDIAISLKNITKTYTLRHEKPTLMEQITHPGKKEKFTAINNLSLEIEKGEKIGIVGLNGSGKTTLLKIIGGITTPNSGTVEVQGKTVSLINLSAGFHQDLTGEENIYLNGMLLGMSKKEINEKLAKIISFAGIHQFIDAPFFTYSDGMKLRLSFAVAAYSKPEILLMDEGSLLAGDIKFQRKMIRKVNQLFLEKKTIIFVSQWLDFIREHCQRVIIMKNGKIYKSGGTEVLNDYERQQS